MAGPGGSEHGRINIKVVPDTDGFTREVERVLAKYANEEITVNVDADTSAAEAKLERLTEKYRDITIQVKANVKSASASISNVARDRNSVIKVTADTATASTQIAAIANTKHTAKIQAVANTTAANAAINRAARDRKTKIRYRFIGDEAVKRLVDLDRKKVQKIDFDFDDTKLRTKLKAIGRDGKIITEVEVDSRNIRDIRRWVGSLGKDFKEAGKELREGFDRIDALRRARDRRLAAAQVAAENAARLRREQENIGTLYRLRERAHAAALREETRREAAATRERARSQEAFDRASARIRTRYYTEAARRAQQELRRLGSDFPDRIPIHVYVDPRRRLAAYRAEIARLERERIELEVSLRGIKGVATRLKLLARDRRVRIQADIDRNQFGRAGYLLGRSFKGFSTVALGAIGGVLRSLSVLSSGLGNVGNIGQKAFGSMADGTSKLAGNASKAANVISGLVASVLALGVGIGIISAIVVVLGSLIVAAIGAVAALASVVIGAAALLALPAIFAGIAIASAGMADRNDKLRKSFGKLKNTVVSTLQRVAKPMTDFFTESLNKMNGALKEGSDLHNELSAAFRESTDALKPLRSGLYSLAFQSLSGVNDALGKLNNSGAFKDMSLGFSLLGQGIGGFASRLADYGPEIANSFNTLSGGLSKVGLSLANWIGRFSSGSAAGVIDSFANATSRLFDVFANNSETYLGAAKNLGDSLNTAVPGFEKITNALARMSPAIFESLASGINKLGNAVSDPGLQQGLASLTTMFIDLTSNILTGAVKAAGAIGNFMRAQGDQWDLWTGHLYDKTKITKDMFSSLMEKEDTVRAKVNKGLQQINFSVNRSARSVGKNLSSYADQAVSAMDKVEGKTGQHLQSLAGKLKVMADQWKQSGGKVSEDWRRSWDQLSKEIDASGSSTLGMFKDNMNRIIQDSDGFRERLKASFVNALEDAGIDPAPLMAQIDQALGLAASAADQKTQQMVSNIQRNFALLPGLLRTAMDNAKTPAELEKNLRDIQGVMERMTPEIATAFAKLPTEMQKTLTESSSKFETWTGMETFRQKVAEGVKGASQEFQAIGTAIGQLTGPMQTLATNAGLMAGSIQTVNSQANWLNWILNQVGAQAQWAGWQMGQIGANAGNAAGAVARLNESANGLQTAFNRGGSAAVTATAKLQSLGSGASVAGGRMSVFAALVASTMARASVAVTSAVAGMLSDLLMLPPYAARAGNLSAFVGAIQRSMAQAQAVVASAVAHMLAQLSRLNTTVTARVRVETSKVPTTNDITPNVAPAFMPMAASFEPMALDAPAPLASTEVPSLGTWSKTAQAALTEGRKSRRDDGPQVVKNYNFNNEIYGPAPTEKRLVKELRFADAMFGE